MFFLATVDEDGQPSCSYKGGAPGFVRVVDPRTLAFPNYDGNGMFLSMGNIAQSRKVGMLFIDFERPAADAAVGRRRGSPTTIRCLPLSRGAVHRARAR